MSKTLIKYFDFRYFIKFILIFLSLYGLNVFYIGLITEGGIYSSFIKEYLNYPSWLISLVLFGSNIITHAVGINSYISGVSLKVYYGSTVNMYWPCIGLQIMSFWVSFIVAHNNKWKGKLYWCIAGVTAITFINILRIAFLSIAMEKRWRENTYLSHHAMFNLAAYTIILLMIYIYYKVNSRVSDNIATSSQ